MRAFLKRVYELTPFKKEAFLVLRELVDVPESIYSHLHFRGPFTIRIDQQYCFQMLCYGNSQNIDLFWRNLNESSEGISLLVWRRLATQASVIIDGGAFAGLYSLLAAAVNPNATVVAFEPLPRAFARLQSNLALNKFVVSAEQIALSDTTGVATLYDLSSEEFAQGASLKHNDRLSDSVLAKTTRLDDYLLSKRIESADLIKLDVEGYELSAMRGLGEYLARHRPSILFEVLDGSLGPPITAFLSTHGYKIFRIDEHRGLFSIGDNDAFSNFIAVARAEDLKRLSDIVAIG